MTDKTLDVHVNALADLKWLLYDLGVGKDVMIDYFNYVELYKPKSVQSGRHLTPEQPSPLPESNQ